MTEFDVFIRVLDMSIKKNDPKMPLTLGHITNIAKLAKKIHNDQEEHNERVMNEALNEIWNDQHKYGSND